MACALSVTGVCSACLGVHAVAKTSITAPSVMDLGANGLSNIKLVIHLSVSGIVAHWWTTATVTAAAADCRPAINASCTNCTRISFIAETVVFDQRLAPGLRRTGVIALRPLRLNRSMIHAARAMSTPGASISSSSGMPWK